MVQRNRLTTFRQDLYDQVFTKRRDAQQELLDALLLSPPVKSFPELSLSVAFKRTWSSLYKALSDGAQDEEALSKLFLRHVPHPLLRVSALDESTWPHPDAHTLEDRGYVHSASPTIDGAGIVVGHSYSTLAVVHAPGESWTLPVSIKRVATRRDAVDVGIEQVRRFLEATAADFSFDLITGDGRYGNHRFLGGLRQEIEQGQRGLLVRLRCDRVLYFDPGPYSGRGRPRKHGAVFRFKDETTWPDPDDYTAFTDERFGEVELRLWRGLHAREDAEIVFSVLQACIHLERDRPPKPLWLAWLGPVFAPEELWRAYQCRGTLEASFRFRKQYLAWTLPRLSTIEASLRWTNLVTMAQWTLYLSRDLVRDQPQPWQKPQRRLTPERVKQSLGGLFREIGTPAEAPKRRGKSPGWPPGRRRVPRDRHPVVRKGAQKAPKDAVT